MQLADTTLSFGYWKYSPGTGTLWRLEQKADTADSHPPIELAPLVLEPRLHKLLNHFLAQPDIIHAKADLLDAIWGDAEGTDAALMRAIGVLRKLLQDTAKPATFIETLPKRGYRWVAPIQVLAKPAADKVALKLKPSVVHAKDESEAESPVTMDPPQAQRLHKREQQRRLKLLSVFFFCAVIALVISLLLFFGKNSFVPAFTQQVTISAMAGQEQRPLLSPDGQTLFYQQRTNDGRLRWIAHHLSSHRKQLQTQQFDALGAGQWLGRDLVFQAVNGKSCSIFRMQVQQLDQHIAPWLPCQQLIAQGLATDGKELVWLDQHSSSGATQLWRFNGEKAELQQSFAESYQKPVAVMLQQRKVWVLLQQDHFNTTLFHYDLSTASLQKAADFPYAFHTMARWDDKKLLLSGPSGSFIFEPANAQLIALQLASGAYADQQKVGERLLATQVPQDMADLLPLQLSDAGRSSTLLSASPWLSSNKTDQLLSWNAAQAALVSERSGLPQIWWFDGTKVSQLTRLTQWRQITQLLWAGAELYAVIDQQLHQVSLQDGSLTAVLFQDRQLRHFAFCHNRWFWAEFNHQQWQLKTMNQDMHPIELRADIVDLRCAPGQSLLLQQQDGTVLRFWLEQEKHWALPWARNWRQLSGNSWATTSKGLYWLDEHGQLWLSDWLLEHRQLIQPPGLLQVTGLYGQLEQEQLFLQLAREPETDVVWLQPQQFQ
ncbi:winged helix-turn-helix domain-containing protein [Rheinheimera texasensis]|uniref:winged helix-turn-helix domain-containing protein n=1 Tax=Rheinheimera texasensis TaxID=306205 RepID=UPI0004E0FBA1|nr:winged helix-turn-helix domain-containing protein [Rheinheimera texasensis]